MRTLILLLTVAFLSSAVSVAVGDRAERGTGEAAVTVPNTTIRNIAGLLREQDTQSDRMERRLRSLQRDMDGIYDRLDAQGTALAGLAGLPGAVNGVNSLLTALEFNMQDQFGSGLRYRGRNLAGLIMCIYDADLRSDKACEGGP